MKHQNIIIGVIAIIIIAIIIIAVIKLNGKPIGVNENMTDNILIGKWNAFSEETLNGLNEDLSQVGEYSIYFRRDKSYSEIIGDTKTNGFYEIEEDKISLYNSKDEIGKQGSFNSGWFIVENDKLTLTLPKYPKTVVYRKG